MRPLAVFAAGTTGLLACSRTGTAPPPRADDSGAHAGTPAVTNAAAHGDACVTKPGHEDPGALPQTDFDSQPSYIPNDTLIITIDDVPEATTTPKILKILHDHHETKVTFFVNTQNHQAPLSILQDMMDAGHTIGNHTRHHHHLAPGGDQDGMKHLATANQIEAEITGVPADFLAATGHALPKLTLFRAPFGEPYQSGSNSDKELVEPVVAKYGVAINWNLDTEDQVDPPPTGDQVFTNFKKLVMTPGASGGSWGIFLIHGISQQDVDAIPRILDYIDANHFKLATVEDVLCWKFGKHSWEIIH